MSAPLTISCVCDRCDKKAVFRATGLGGYKCTCPCHKGGAS